MGLLYKSGLAWTKKKKKKNAENFKMAEVEHLTKSWALFSMELCVKA